MAKNALEKFTEVMEAAKANVRESADFQKGLATLGGYARGGLKDLQSFVVHAFPDSMKQHEALGMAASPTPQQVYEGLTGKDSPASGKNIDMDLDR